MKLDLGCGWEKAESKEKRPTQRIRKPPNFTRDLGYGDGKNGEANEQGEGFFGRLRKVGKLCRSGI